VEVVTIETPELGDRSYLVHDGEIAVVVDPQRDVDRIEAAALAAGVRIAAVAETHIHNDYVTGGLALATRHEADYLVAAADPVHFARRAVSDGDQIDFGRLRLRVIATPGHTPNHVSYAIGEGADPEVVCTGGSMLYGTVGRTDLIAPEHTEPLTRAQWRSVRRLAAELPAATVVLPTHGFGSFCSSAPPSGAAESRIADEAAVNLACALDEEEFVRSLIAGLTPYPRYYAHMGRRNLAGPKPAVLDPPEIVDPEVLLKRIEAGEWVVDLRDRRAYARRHLEGTVGIELGSLFATYLGWVVPYDAAITLVGDSLDEVVAARRQLVRIGVDELAGAAVGGVDRLAEAGSGRLRLHDYPVVDFAGLAGALTSAPGRILDVRRDDEWVTGAIPGALHIPIHDLLDRLDEVPDDRLYVHCAAGFRAAVGASLLHRVGRDVVLVDDDFSAAAPAGFEVVAPRL